MSNRREAARYSREVREYTEALAPVASKLIAAESANDETTYNTTYEAEWAPIYLNCLRAIGAEMARAVVRDAYTLARAV